MKVITTRLPGVLIIEPTVYRDDRGFFTETFHIERYQEVGISLPFVQENHSRSRYGVLRGLHQQRTRPQGKLVRLSRGAAFDVAVDLNPNSATYKHYVGVELSDENHRQLWIPPGYAHGFCALSDVADVQYSCTDVYCPDDEEGVRWDDPDLAIPWPIQQPILSAKDLALPTLQERMHVPK